MSNKLFNKICNHWDKSNNVENNLKINENQKCKLTMLRNNKKNSNKKNKNDQKNSASINNFKKIKTRILNKKITLKYIFFCF